LDERGIDVLIDGAHTPGMIPLDLRRLGAAYYTGNCHKWLCSPKGAGFLYVRPDRQEGVMPPVIGHGYNKPRPSYSRFQDLFDWPGTFDPSAWISVGYAIKFLSGLLEGGLPALMQRNHDLAIWARRMLLERLGRRTGFQPVNKRQVGNLSYDTVQPIGPESMLGSMAAMILPGDNDERHDCTTTPTPMHWLNGELWEKHRIETVVYNWPAAPQRVLRISAQVYNTPEQYERLADALRPYV
jgi:isopenicillin-N epimerase